MIVDCHTHINLTDAFDSEKFEQASEDVSNAFVLASPQESSSDSNKKVAQFAASNSKVVPFGVFNPLKDDFDLLRDFAEKKLSGVVMYCSDFGMHPAHSKAIQAYKIVSDLEIPVFFHNQATTAQANLEYSQPFLLDEIARLFPELKIVVAGMGEPFVEQTLALIKKNPNVYACLTVNPDKPWALYNLVTAACEAEVLEKLFFGSGYPQGKITQSVEALLGFNRLFADMQFSTVPRAQLREIVERDAMAILGITQ